MTLSIDDILADAELPETTVALCLRGGLAARYDALAARWAESSDAASSLGEPSERSQLAEEMADLRQQMKAAEVVFKLRAMPRKKFSDLYARQPETPTAPAGQEISEQDRDAFVDKAHQWQCAMVAATVYDPPMTAAKAERLADKMSNGQWKKLTDAVITVNVGDAQIPFFAPASAHLQRTGQK